MHDLNGVVRGECRDEEATRLVPRWWLRVCPPAKRPSSTAGAVALWCLAVWFGLVAAPARADGLGNVTWSQATAMPFGWGVFEPAISADGRFVAFRAAFNLVGENADVNFEIFLYDRVANAFTQVTHTPTLYGNFEPMITPDGSAVVFRSLYNFVGTNPDGSFELFEYTVATGAFKQLTFTPAGATVTDPHMSADGTCITYLSNFDGTNDVMRLKRPTRGGAPQVIGVTNFPSGCTVMTPTISGDGTVVVFRSNHNLNGWNPDGSQELWIWHEGTGIELLTDSAQIDEAPSIDASGRFVAFLTRANYGGQNPGFNQEIFIADTVLDTLTLATPPFNFGVHLNPTMSPDGTMVVWESNRDIVGLNPDKNRELFRYSRLTGSIEQMTQTIGGASIAGLSEAAMVNYVAIAADGVHFAYRNEHELDPEAEDPEPQVNFEIFVATLGGIAPVADLDGDGIVGNSDLAICLGAWGTADPLADLNQDGVVDLADISILLGAWGDGGG